MGFSFVENCVAPQGWGETLHVMTYALGKVIEYYHKAKRYGPIGYYCEENQKKEMSDLISMCRMYCEQRGWDFEDLMKLGERAYIERMQDLQKHGLDSSQQLSWSDRLFGRAQHEAEGKR